MSRAMLDGNFVEILKVMISFPLFANPNTLNIFAVLFQELFRDLLWRLPRVLGLPNIQLDKGIPTCFTESLLVHAVNSLELSQLPLDSKLVHIRLGVVPRDELLVELQKSRMSVCRLLAYDSFLVTIRNCLT